MPVTPVTNKMKQGDDVIPVAVPVSEKMERHDPPVGTQDQVNQNGAVVLLASSCGAECVRMGAGCSATKYGVFTLYPDANGRPMPSNDVVPAMVAKYTAKSLLKIFEGPRRNAAVMVSLLHENGNCGERVWTLSTPSGGNLGKIRSIGGCGLSYEVYEVSGADDVPLYRVTSDGSCFNNKTIRQLDTNLTIGHVNDEGGFCSVGKLSVSYLPDILVEHKLMLVAFMCAMQLSSYADSNSDTPGHPQPFPSS